MCKSKSKESVDELATTFVALASISNCFHASWLLLSVPCLSGARMPTPFSVAIVQHYLVQQSVEWGRGLLAPFFARMTAGKMKRKRQMKEADLTESFQIVLELVTSDEALATLPRGVQAIAGLLWANARNLGMDQAAQIEIVADFFFQRLVYPVLLVPDQFELVPQGNPLPPLARDILQGVCRCLSAGSLQMSVANTPYAYMQPFVKAAWPKMAQFAEKLALDPKQQGWGDFVFFPSVIDVEPHHGDGGVGMWLRLLLEAGTPLQNKELEHQLEVVGSELERRRAIEHVISEEKEFTMRLDGVTFWLRDLDYGVMMEGTALRMANEWLKKVNQLRAVTRIGLNKRTHYTQWNGRISDLFSDADFAVYAEFAKILKSTLPIVANSVDQSLERAVLAYKQETSRDPLRDLVALLVHGKTLLTRIDRLPPALEEEERQRMDLFVKNATKHLNEELSSECSEMVRLHQMQSSIVSGWSCFPHSLLEQSGLVKAGRKQVAYGKVVSIHPSALKSAKYAMLLSDCLILLETVTAEHLSSARDREACFGGGNVFQMSVPNSSDKGVRKANESKSKKQLKGIDVCFRMVACFNLNGGRVRLKPAQNSFVFTDSTNQSVEITVTPAQKLEWVTAWSKIECMEHSQRLDAPISSRGDGAGSLDVPSPRRTPRSSDNSPKNSPRGSPGSSPRPPPSEDEDVDEIEALMALGMYDTAVLKKPDAEPNADDNQFLSMVGQMKRRDGKARVSLLELFVPPPGLVVKEWQVKI